MMGTGHVTHCAVPRCPNYSQHRGYCLEHALLPDYRWRKLSKAILMRDGYRCWICGARATTADHVTPRAQGGAAWDPHNLRACCRPCNSGRRETTL